MYRFAMRIAVLAALAAALLLAPATSASAAVVVNERIQIDNLVVNTCNGEVALLSGVLHTVVLSQPDGSMVTHINGEFTGTGSLGNEYVLSFRTQSVIEQVPFSITLTNRQLAVTKGSAPNQLATITVSFPPLMVDVETVCHG